VSHLAWAIDTRSKEGHGLLGKFWWFNGKSWNITPHMTGYRAAVFPTRAEARKALKAIKRESYQAFPDACVVHVKVDVSVVGK